MYDSRTNCHRGSDGRTTHPPTHSLPSSRPPGSGETRDTERPAPLPSSFLSTFGNESKDINPHSNNTQRVSTAHEERTPGMQCWAGQRTCFLPQTWIVTRLSLTREASQYLTQSWTPQSHSTFNKQTRARLTHEARSSKHPPGNPCTHLIYVLKLRQNRTRTLESVWAQTQAFPFN